MRHFTISVLLFLTACHQSVDLSDSGLSDSGLADSSTPDVAIGRDADLPDLNAPDNQVSTVPPGCKLVEYDSPIVLEEAVQYCFPDGTSFRATIQNQLCPCDADCDWEGEVVVQSTWFFEGSELFERRTGSSQNTNDPSLPNGAALSIVGYQISACPEEFVSDVEFLVSSPTEDCTPAPYNDDFAVEEGRTYCFEDGSRLVVSRVSNELCGCEDICAWEGEVAVYGTWIEGGESTEFRVGSVTTRREPLSLGDKIPQIETYGLTDCPEQRLVEVRFQLIDGDDTPDQ